MSSRAGWIALIAGIVLRASLIVMIAACRTGVVGPARPVIVVESPAEESITISEQVDGGLRAREVMVEQRFAVGSELVFRGGTFERCRTSQEVEGKDMFGGNTTTTEYDEHACNEKPLPVTVTCRGPCKVRDNDTPVVIVRATGGGVIDIEARMDGAETKRARYSVAVADSLFWSPSTDGADATGCPASITSPEAFPIVVMRRAGTVPLWFPQTKTAIASVCVTRSGEMPACHDVRRDARGVVEVGAAEMMRRGGPGAYEVTVAYDTYDAKPLRCATVLK